MTDIVAWGDKSRCLLAFAVQAHNATWDSHDVVVKLGHGVGSALLLSFAVECALKALLETEGTPITKDLQIHRLHKLFLNLEPATQAKVSDVYEHLIESETDPRILGPTTKSLGACLESHDNAFKAWRYDVGNAGAFYPAAMTYACVSLLTLVFPDLKFVVGSLTSSRMEVLGANATTQQDDR